MTDVVNALPIQPTPLLGREQEVATTQGLLCRQEVRLLTLTGAGGTGKTRMALQLAAALHDQFADGVRFVALAPTRDPALVCTTIVQVLGLKHIGDEPPRACLLAYLRDKHLLLVLDNFEHVASAASLLAELLETCPHLKLLVTSRELLHLRAEYQFSVPPLALPNLKNLPDLESLSHYAAVELFVQRTQAILPDFHLTPENAATIAEICVRLDGLPLALELAAARVNMLSPPVLLARLDHPLQVLTSKMRDVPERQQTLRNTLAWSYDLLNAEEQRVFRRLSIFVGGWSLEAAEAVCKTDDDKEMDVLDAMSTLLEKSLVQRSRVMGEEPRLMMLETIREFGLECLAAQGELEAARQAHAWYYLALAEEAELHIVGHQQLVWFRRLEREFDNFRAILQSATTGGAEEVRLALRLGTAMWFFWLGRGYMREGRGFLEQNLARARALGIPILPRTLIIIAGLMWGQNDSHGLEQIAEEALTLAQAQGDQWDMIAAMSLRGAAMMIDRRDYATAQACLEEALTCARIFGDRLVLAFVLLNLGRLMVYQRDYHRAVTLFEQSLMHCRVMGGQVMMSMVLGLLARAEWSQGNGARARLLLEESLTIFQEFGHTWGSALILGLLGRLAFQQGEMSQAEELLTKSARLSYEAGDRRSLAHMRLLLAGLSALQGDYVAARRRYEEGLATALDIGQSGLIASGLKGLGCVAAAQGMYTWATQLWGTAENLRESRSVAIPPAIYEQMVEAVRSHLGVPAFRQALAQGRSLTPEQALAAREPLTLPAVISPVLNVPATSAAGLTRREMEVLRLLTRGLTNPQIAEQLAVSLPTVNTHVASIYNKLGVTTRSAATRYAVEHHLV